MRITYVIIQGNYVGVLCNILAWTQMRTCCMIIQIENIIISHVNNYEDGQTDYSRQLC